MPSFTKRHPALDVAVFAAALILGVFIAREVWKRYSVSVDNFMGGGPSAVNTGGAATGTLETSEVFSGVSSVPAMRIKPSPRRPRPVDVPAP